MEKLNKHFPRPSGHHHALVVEPAHGGFIIRVGCQPVVATDIEAVIPHIVDYLRDPHSWTSEREGLMRVGLSAAATPVLNRIEGRNADF